MMNFLGKYGWFIIACWGISFFVLVSLTSFILIRDRRMSRLLENAVARHNVKKGGEDKNGVA